MVSQRLDWLALYWLDHERDPIFGIHTSLFVLFVEQRALSMLWRKSEQVDHTAPMPDTPTLNSHAAPLCDARPIDGRLPCQTAGPSYDPRPDDEPAGLRVQKPPYSSLPPFSSFSLRRSGSEVFLKCAVVLRKDLWFRSDWAIHWLMDSPMSETQFLENIRELALQTRIFSSSGLP